MATYSSYSFFRQKWDTSIPVLDPSNRGNGSGDWVILFRSSRVDPKPMKTSDKTLMEQLRLTSREIVRRKEYFFIKEADCVILQSMREQLVLFLDDIIDKFYRALLSHDEIDQIIGDAETLVRLKNHFKSYLVAMFEGVIDEEYVHSRLRVGLVHRRIGVEGKFYVAAVHLLGSILKENVVQKQADLEYILAQCAAIDRILLFDLSLTFDTYIHSLMDESRRSSIKLEEYAESLEETVAERTRLLKEQARHDGLTGLLNQKSFYSELRRALSRGQRQGYSVVLIYFDIDGFKKINDSKGHRAGDEILVKVAEAARQTTREGETVARYGGDEFCIIMADSSVSEAEVLSERLCKMIKQSISDSSLSCSIGISISSPDRFLDADSLVKSADKAMYRAKKSLGYKFVTAAVDEADNMS